MDPLSIDAECPFGENACEVECSTLGMYEYQQLFLSSGVDIYERALRPKTYLIRGRRGAGKTALTQYFGFQKAVPLTCLILDKDTLPTPLLYRIGWSSTGRVVVDRPMLQSYWEMHIWAALILFYASRVPEGRLRGLAGELGLRMGAVFQSTSGGSFRINGSLDTVFDAPMVIDSTDRQAAFFRSEAFREAREIVLAYSKSNASLVAIDTEEQYDASSERIMTSLGALVQCAADYNSRYIGNGLHIKVFLADEIFPRLEAEYVSNTLKAIREVEVLKWRPKDLLRMVCHRVYRYFERGAFVGYSELEPKDWGDFEAVHRNIWRRLFGDELMNRRGHREPTFSYVMRHTQLRPRQVIRMCNRIAENQEIQQKLRRREIPVFSEEAICDGVRSAETNLAVEVINSYVSIHRNLLDLVSGLGSGSALIQGSDLHRAASRSARWMPEGMDRERYIEILVQMGVIGRLRKQRDDRRIITADFQYNMDHMLRITEGDTCVVHPMFCELLNRRGPYPVLPFPDHSDFSGMTPDDN